MKERIRTSILVILAAVALIATVVSIYSAEYVGGLACAVVLASVVFDLFDQQRKQIELSKDEEKAIEDAANAVVMLCAYKITPDVIKYYSEDYPYLVVAEKPSSTVVEYWWAGDKEANDLVHSRVADKYKQLGHYVIANAVKGEVHHGDKA